MPPKKSKKKQPVTTKAVEDAGLLDMFSFLDEVQECLDCASFSPSSCLEGIVKADEALRHSQGDSGIQCTILMKRAQLLFTAVEKKYDTSGLSAQHRNALESCISDCEKVLSGLSSTDPVTREIYQAAQELNSQAIKIKAKTLPKVGIGTPMGSDVRTRNTQLAAFQIARAEAKRPTRFNPEQTVFKNITKINPYLLQDVVNCYQMKMIVCKFCFFRNNYQEKVGHNRYCRKCKRISPSILVIPASKMCKNFANMKFIPIPPPPKVMLANGNKHKPFQYCHNPDHTSCFERSATGDIWFAHSIEELVIWTVERHYGCNFGQYIMRHHMNVSLSTASALLPGSGELDDFDSSLSGSIADADDDSSFEFYPDHLRYDCVASVPQHLLNDILECFDKVKEYCMWCFYKRRKMGVVTLDPASRRMICSICKCKWESVLVIPASDYCWNFGEFEHLPIAPRPQDKPSMGPYEYCAKDDHFRCFKVYIDSEFWYAHSVEELVIWTVEREHDCKFSEYAKKVRKSLPPELTPIPVPPSQHPTSIKQTLSSSMPPAKTASIPIVGPSSSSRTGQPTSVTPTFSSVLMSPPRSSRLNFHVVSEGSGTTPPFIDTRKPPGWSHLSTSSVGAISTSVGAMRTSVITANSPIHTVNQSGNATNSSKVAINSTANVWSHWNGGVSSSVSAGYPLVGAGGSGQIAVAAVGPVTTAAEVTPRSVRDEESQQVYKLSEISYKALEEIPQHLLESIAYCFCQKKEVCRKCFYGDRSLSSWLQEENVCSLSQHKWMNPILVIPGCDLCDNEPCFKKGAHIPIPPLPPVAIIKKCERSNHHKCFSKSLESNEWYAHSVEELVVWVVESEKECSFEEYIIHELQIQISTKPVETTCTSNPEGQIPELPKTASPNRIPASPNRTPSSVNTAHPVEQRPNKKKMAKFDPNKTVFCSVSEIPDELLAEVARCFQQRMLICRMCYFVSNCNEFSSKMSSRNTCERGHPWKHIRVIPRCTLCIGSSPFVAIPPLPKHMKHCNSPFQVCKKADHQTCYSMSKNTNPWFPHTVEELVVWTVERETGCNFEQVYEPFLSKATPGSQPTSAAASIVDSGPSTLQTSTDNSIIAPNLSHPSIDTLDLTKPEDKEPSKSYYPSGNGGEFDVNLHTPVLGFEDAVFLASSKGASSKSNIAKPPPMAAHSQVTPDTFYNNFTNYNTMPEFPSPQLGQTAMPVDSMGLPIAASMGDNPVSPFSGMQIDTPEGCLTADDALEYFPALLGNRAPEPMPFQGAENTLLHLGSDGRVIEGQNQVGGAAGITSDANFLDPVAINASETLYTTSSVMTSTHTHNPLFQGGEQHLLGNTDNVATVPSHEYQPVSISNRPNSTGPTIPINDHPVLENWPEISHPQAEQTAIMAVSNSSQPASSQEDHSLPRMPNSHPLVLEKASELDDLGMNKTSLVSKSDTPSEKMASFVSANKIAGNEDLEASEAYQCLLCYVSFELAEQLAEHCKSAKHVINMLLDSGNKFLWKHLPPPLGKTPEDFGICPNPDQCCGGLQCQKPHYTDELSEWMLRYEHRNSRHLKQTTKMLALPLPTLAEQETGLLLNEYHANSQYQAVRLSLSDPVQVTTSSEDSSFSWKITLEGENWQSMHGVSCQTLTPSVFRITKIEGDTFFTIQPKSLSWKARSVNHAILLGRITITIKATPASVGSYSTQVHLDLGFHQFLYLNLELIVKGTTSPRVVENASSPMMGLLPQLLPQPVPETASTPDEEQIQQQEELDKRQVEEDDSSVVLLDEVRKEEKLEEDQEGLVDEVDLGEHEREMEEEKRPEETAKIDERLTKKQTNEPYGEEQATGQQLHFEHVLEEDTSLLPLPAELQEQQPHVGWQLSSSSSDELGMPNIEGEDLTLIHVPIEDLGFSLTGESGVILSDSLNINGCN